MKKLSLILAILIFVLSTGCSDTKQTSVTFKSPKYISDYERAEFEKFNSPAEENGLGGTLIYIDGVFEIFDIVEDTTLAYATLNEGINQWLIIVGLTTEVSIEELQKFINKPVRVFCVYRGFESIRNKPTADCIKFTFTETGEAYHILEFTSSASPLMDTYLSNTVESAEKLNKSPQNKEAFDRTAHDFIRDFSLKSDINLELKSDYEFDDYISYKYENAGDKKEIEISIYEDIENKKIDYLTVIFLNEFLQETYCTILKLLDTSITTDKQAIAIYNTLIEAQKDSPSGVGHAKTDKCSYLMEIAESGTIYISIKKI